MTVSNELWARLYKATVPLTVAALVALIMLLCVANHLVQQNRHDRIYQRLLHNMEVLAREIESNTLRTSLRQQEGYRQLRQAQAAFEQDMETVMHGTTASGLPPVIELAAPISLAAAELDIVWRDLQKSTAVVLNRHEELLSLQGMVSTLTASYPQLQSGYEQIVDILLDKNATAEQVATIGDQALRLARLGNRVSTVMEQTNGTAAATALEHHIGQFRRVQNGLRDGDQEHNIDKINYKEAAALLEEMEDLAAFVLTSVDEVVQLTPALQATDLAFQTALSTTPKLFAQLDALTAALESERRGRSLFEGNGYTLLVCFLLFVLPVITIGMSRLRTLHSRYRRSVSSHAAIRQAVQQLTGSALAPSSAASDHYSGPVKAVLESLGRWAGYVRAQSQTVARAAAHSHATANGWTGQVKQYTDTVAQTAACAQTMADSHNAGHAIMAEISTVNGQLASAVNTLCELADSSAAAVSAPDALGPVCEQLHTTAQELQEGYALFADVAEHLRLMALSLIVQNGRPRHAPWQGQNQPNIDTVSSQLSLWAEELGGTVQRNKELLAALHITCKQTVAQVDTSVPADQQILQKQQQTTVLADLKHIVENLEKIATQTSCIQSEQAALACQFKQTEALLQEGKSRLLAGCKEATSIAHVAARESCSLREAVSASACLNASEGNENTTTPDTTKSFESGDRGGGRQQKMSL